jgi:triosephosphate isomerase (TIM)
MNLVRHDAQALVAEIIGMFEDEVSIDIKIAIIPSFIHIGLLTKQVAGYNRIGIGAQDCSIHDAGAYTGEVSAAMIKSAGASYVLVGHSERRQYHNETNQQISLKIDQALKNELTPIFCFGESLEQRNDAIHLDTVKNQIAESIFHLSDTDILKCKFAYEPVWAIGTGMTAKPEQVQEMHAFIRNQIAKQYSLEIAEQITILYGGSCNDQNAKELFALKDVDGGLIGGASLKSRSFVNIVKAITV